MNKLKENINNLPWKKIIAVLFIFVWIFITLFNPDIHKYNTDEIHAWNIASNFNFFEIIKLMRIEGHTFIWYMLLKPFTYFPNVFFPWIIKGLNWFFMLCALCVFGGNHQ